METTFGKNQPADLTRERCRAYASEQIEEQKAGFVRLGVLVTGANPYLTMNFANEAGEIRALGELVKKGFVFKGLKPVNFCFDCGSAWPRPRWSTRTSVPTPFDVAFRSPMPTSWQPPSASKRCQAHRHRHLDHHPL